MATYAQLQAESWWGREITTPEVAWLGDELCRRTKRPQAAFGSKGDNHHLRGAHRSQEWILKSRYCTSRTYTVQTGLTAAQQRHIAGVDFTPGSAEQMIAQCRRIYAAVRAGQLEEVREFYGNVDGDKVVDGWDNVRNRAASSDSSHLWHWHLSLDRRHCADRRLMERILAIVLGEGEWDEMASKAEIKEALVEVLRTPLPFGASGPQRRLKDPALHPPAGWADQSVLGLLAYLFEASRSDQANEQQIIDGVLDGLGSQDLDDAATALRAAFGDRLPELVALLGATESQARG